jgi:hypothetical protein
MRRIYTMSKESKHVAVFRERHQKAGETVVGWVEGYIGKMMGGGDDRQHNGALIITDQRVAFYRKGLLGEVFQAIPLSKITSVEQKSTMGHVNLTVHTSHDDLSFKTFQKAELEAAVEAIERGRDGAGASTGRAPAPAAADPAVALQKLKELHASGLVSDEEFESKKQEILARL